MWWNMIAFKPFLRRITELTKYACFWCWGKSEPPAGKPTQAWREHANSYTDRPCPSQEWTSHLAFKVMTYYNCGHGRRLLSWNWLFLAKIFMKFKGWREIHSGFVGFLMVLGSFSHLPFKYLSKKTKGHGHRFAVVCSSTGATQL